MRVLGAHTSVHHTKQAHKAPINDLGKRPNKILSPMMLDQSRTMQQEVPMEGACGVLMNERTGITHGPCGWCMRGTWMTHKRRRAHRKGASKTCSWPTKRSQNLQRGNGSHVRDRLLRINVFGCPT